MKTNDYRNLITSCASKISLLNSFPLQEWGKIGVEL